MAANPEEMREQCDACASELELGQIGKCDSCQEHAESEEAINHYRCSCGKYWEKTQFGMSNDNCPTCSKDTVPFLLTKCP